MPLRVLPLVRSISSWSVSGHTGKWKVPFRAEMEEIISFTCSGRGGSERGDVTTLFSTVYNSLLVSGTFNYEIYEYDTPG